MTSISSYLKPRSTSLLDEDTYDFTITKAEVRKENGVIVYNDKDQPSAVITFTIDGYEDDAGGPILVDKWFTITYGKSHKGPWAGLAQLIEAVLGIPCGDAAQRHVTFEDLLGKKGRAAIIHHVKDGNTYMRVDKVMKLKTAAANGARPAARPVAPAPSMDSETALSDDELERILPF